MACDQGDHACCINSVRLRLRPSSPSVSTVLARSRPAPSLEDTVAGQTPTRERLLHRSAPEWRCCARHVTTSSRRNGLSVPDNARRTDPCADEGARFESSGRTLDRSGCTRRCIPYCPTVATGRCAPLERRLCGTAGERAAVHAPRIRSGSAVGMAWSSRGARRSSQRGTTGVPRRRHAARAG